jgi:hypothetical protein
MNHDVNASISLVRGRKITLFSILNHLAKLADPRYPDPSQASLRALTEALILTRQNDPEFSTELEEWTKQSLGMISRIQAARD